VHCSPNKISIGNCELSGNSHWSHILLFSQNLKKLDISAHVLILGYTKYTRIWPLRTMSSTFHQCGPPEQVSTYNRTAKWIQASDMRTFHSFNVKGSPGGAPLSFRNKVVWAMTKQAEGVILRLERNDTVCKWREDVINQWFPTGGTQAFFRWAMAPFRILVCLNALSGGEKHPSWTWNIADDAMSLNRFSVKLPISPCVLNCQTYQAKT